MTVIIKFKDKRIMAFESVEVVLNAADKTVDIYYNRDGEVIEYKLDTIEHITVDGAYIWHYQCKEII